MAASLLLAVGFWYFVNARAKIDVGYLVPLVFENLPGNVAIDGTTPGSIHVRLRGFRQAVETILPQELQVRVDLSGAVPGEVFVKITPEMVLVPPGVTLLGVSPAYLDLRFLARSSVPVRVRTEGRPAPGFAVLAAAAVPSEVEIVGPADHVAAVEAVEAAPVAIEGRRTTLRRRAELVLPSAHVRLLELLPTEVVVEIGPAPAEPRR